MGAGGRRTAALPVREADTHAGAASARHPPPPRPPSSAHRPPWRRHPAAARGGGGGEPEEMPELGHEPAFPCHRYRPVTRTDLPAQPVSLI